MGTGAPWGRSLACCGQGGGSGSEGNSGNVCQYAQVVCVNTHRWYVRKNTIDSQISARVEKRQEVHVRRTEMLTPMDLHLHWRLNQPAKRMRKKYYTRSKSLPGKRRKVQYGWVRAIRWGGTWCFRIHGYTIPREMRKVRTARWSNSARAWHLWNKEERVYRPEYEIDLEEERREGQALETLRVDERYTEALEAALTDGPAPEGVARLFAEDEIPF